MKDIISGLYTQVQQLKKRLKNLNIEKVDSTELKNTLDSLRDLETRLTDAKKAKEERKKAKEEKAKELEKQSVEEESKPEEAEVLQSFEKPEYFHHPKRPPIKPHTIKDVPPLQEPPKVEGAEDQLPGGLADKKKDSEFDKKELAKGVQVELEHTSNIDLAKEIAKDHLMEDPKYYTTLDTIHKEEVEKEAVVEKFALDDEVEPVSGTPGSVGQVMRYDADRDMAYIKWNEGKLAEDHGFGAYSSNDLRKKDINKNRGVENNVQEIGTEFVKGNIYKVQKQIGNNIKIFNEVLHWLEEYSPESVKSFQQWGYGESLNSVRTSEKKATFTDLNQAIQWFNEENKVGYNIQLADENQFVLTQWEEQGSPVEKVMTAEETLSYINRYQKHPLWTGLTGKKAASAWVGKGMDMIVDPLMDIGKDPRIKDLEKKLQNKEITQKQFDSMKYDLFHAHEMAASKKKAKKECQDTSGTEHAGPIVEYHGKGSGTPEYYCDKHLPSYKKKAKRERLIIKAGHGFQKDDRVSYPDKGEGTVTYVGTAPGGKGWTDLVTVDWDNPVQQMLGPEPLSGNKIKQLKKIESPNVASKTLGLSKLADDEILPSTKVPVVEIEAPTLDNLKSLLERAANVLQDSVEGDYNDPTAMEIYEVLKTFPKNPSEKHIATAIVSIKRILSKVEKKAGKLPRKQQKELDVLIQNAVYGYQINMMDLSKVYRAGEEAYLAGKDVTEAVRALLDQIATKTSQKKADADPKDPQAFFEYCWMFYSPDGMFGDFFGNKLNPEDLKAAIAKRMATPDFEGDTFDREAVRDILLADPKYSRKKGSQKKADEDMGFGGDRPGVWVSPKTDEKVPIKTDDKKLVYFQTFKGINLGKVVDTIENVEKDLKSKGITFDKEQRGEQYMYTLFNAPKHLGNLFKKKADDVEELPEDEMIDADNLLPIEPSEDDIVIVTEGQLGSEYAAYQSGKKIARAVEWDDLEAQIREHMKGSNFYPDIWFQDDHGGLTLTTVEASKKKKAFKLIAGFVNVMNRKWEYIPQYGLEGGMVPLTGYIYKDDTGQRILEIKTDKPFTQEQHEMVIYKEYGAKVMASKKKNEKIGMNFKHLYKLAIECPDCFKKFIKFANEKGTTLVVDNVETTVEQLKQKIEDTKKRLESKGSKKEAKEHKLIVKSLDDAQAVCSAGDWSFSQTGSATRSEIEENFKKHLDQHKEAQTPPGPPPQEDPGEGFEWYWDGLAWVKKQKGEAGGGMGATPIQPY